MKLMNNLVFAAMLAILLAGCAGERYHREGMNLLAEGKVEDGLSKLEQAVQEEPGNVKFKSDLLTRKVEQINRLLATAASERNAGKLDVSVALYQRILKIEPNNNRANEGLEAIERDRRHHALIEEAKEEQKKGDANHASALLRLVLTENLSNVDALGLKRQIDEQQVKERTTEPALRTMYKKPISLEFRDANLKVVLEALARSTGVDFILDKDVRPDLRTTIFLRQASLEDAIEVILQTNRLEKKVLNRNTILIYPNSPEKLKEYQELVVKGFYLSNADIKQTQAMLKSMLKTKDTFIDEKLNLLMIRDTPEAIRLAEKLIAMHDLAEPEVMLDVEVMEVTRTRLLELGVQWPNQLSLTPLSASGSTSTTLNDLLHLNSNRIGAVMPGTTINMNRATSDANILANPRIRVRNREKAKIMVGDKVPVSTSTTTATGIISESVQYLDVGIKLEVEPNIYLKDDVAIKVGLEVSSIVNQVKTPGGSLAYQIGSRSASTLLQLKDGETQVLAGLINDADRTGANRVPGLGDIPLLGRLFSTQKDDRQKTEIVLSITPHLVRNIRRPEAATSEFWSGTEASLRTQPLTLKMLRISGDGKSEETGSTSANNSSAPDVKDGAPPSMIALNWKGPNQVKAGEQFKVSLKMKSDGEVRSLPFQLSFDPAAFQVLEVTEGPFFKQNDAQTSLSSNVDASAGKVFVSIVRSGNDGARGEDDVAVLTIRALTAKLQAEIKVLTATPVSTGDKNVVPALPAPFVINIVN
jgi:general secretion pathway protein D